MIPEDVVQQICLACLMKSYMDSTKLNNYLINTVFINNPAKITTLNHYFDFNNQSLSDNFINSDLESKKNFLRYFYYYNFDKMIRKISNIDVVSEKAAKSIGKILDEFKIKYSIYKFRISIDYENKKTLSKIAVG
jgi:hypothetical protein